MNPASFSLKMLLSTVFIMLVADGNAVSHLFPQISAFHVHITPNPHGGFRLHVSCRTKTSNSPKILLFINHYDLVGRKHGDYASFKTDYNTTQESFKCIVENEYGRDMISLGGQNLEGYLNPNDSFKYEVINNIDKRGTKMIYIPGQPGNLTDFMCSYKYYDKYYNLHIDYISDTEKVLYSGLVEFDQYKCKLADNKEFKTQIYTKDWLKMPEISDVEIMIRPNQSSGTYNSTILCQEHLKTQDSPFAMSLYDDDKMLSSRKDVWRGTSKGLLYGNHSDKLTKRRCVVENEMGYDMLMFDYEIQAAKDLEVPLKIEIKPDNIMFSFDNKGPEYFKYDESTICHHNKTSAIDKTHFDIKNKQDHSEYSCTSNLILCNSIENSESCGNKIFTVKLTWTRKLMNFFPDGSLKIQSPNDKFESFFSFFEQKYLYPKISTFNVHVTSNPDGGFRLHISCRTRTSSYPRIMLFVNHYDLVENKCGHHASFQTQYKPTQQSFKCIVENEYGRDVISWGGQNLEEYLNQKDTFKYEVDADKQETKMIYVPGQQRNLDNVICSVKEKNEYIKLRFEKNKENERVFPRKLDKSIQYKCKFIENKEFQSHLYTKDWLKLPKLITVFVYAKPIHEQSKSYNLHISCRASVKTPGSPFVTSLHDADKVLQLRKDVWRNSMERESVVSQSHPAEYNKLRCVVENEMGYDMVLVHFKTQVPNNSTVQLRIGLEGVDILSSFIYDRPERNETKCKHNNETEIEKIDFFLSGRQNHGIYSCISNVTMCSIFGDPGSCQNEISNVELTWERKLMNFFPDGSLKLKDPSDDFESFFGFSEERYMNPLISAFHIHITPNPHGGFELIVSCQTNTPNNPKIMLFVNHYDLVESKHGGYASFKTHYTNEETFKCIVENKYGRDVISWGGQNFEEFLHQKDSLKYEVDADKQKTKIIYIPGQNRNLDNISCSVKGNDEYIKLTFEKNRENEIVFSRKLEKSIQYKCNFIENKEFQTRLYTKDWLKIPQLIQVFMYAKPIYEPNNLHMSCRASVTTPGSPFIRSLHAADKVLQLRKNIWQNSLEREFVESDSDLDEYNKLRCIIENEMGYDMITVDFKTQVPNNSNVQIQISPEGDDILSSFTYFRPKRDTTKCKRNNEAQLEETYFFLRDRQNHGNYSCISNITLCTKFGDSGSCQIQDPQIVKLTWKRKLMNFFPDGSLKKQSPEDEFLSYFGFYNMKPRISAFNVHITPNLHGGFELYISCQTRTVYNPKIMLFVNQYSLVESKRANFASFKTDYNATQEVFKCIVENEYGRDVISWGGYNLKEYLNQKDSFKYKVNVDKKISKLIYTPGQPRNLDNISCSIKDEKNKDNKFHIDQNGDKQKVFTVTFNKFVKYICKLKDNKEFKTRLYTKDWLKLPEITGVIILVEPSLEQGKLYHLKTVCQISGKTPGSPFTASLYNGDEVLESQKDIWQGLSKLLVSSSNITELTKSRCIVENEMGYDMLTIEYKTQVRINSKVMLDMQINPDKVKSRFIYIPENNDNNVMSQCQQNNVAEIEKNHFYLETKQGRSEYSCITNITNCNKISKTEYCWKKTYTTEFTLARKLMNFFPDGSLKLQPPKDKFSSFFGFYDQN